MTQGVQDYDPPSGSGRRRLRAILAADAANFSGRMSINETRAVHTITEIRKIGLDELQLHGGRLYGMPGDGLFALFESAVDALRCALAIQARLSARPMLDEMKLRIGVHLGEVIFENDAPFGEALAIAARLESLADPGGVLVSGVVMEATAARVAAVFEDRGVPRMKNLSRRITTYSVRPAPTADAGDHVGAPRHALDLTTSLGRTTLSGMRSAGTAPGTPCDMSSGPAPPVATTHPPIPNPTVAQPVHQDSTLEPTEVWLDAQAVGEPAWSGIAPADSTPLPPERAVAPPSAEPTPAFIADIAAALTVHLGPLARLMVARRATEAKSMKGLCLALEEAIPNEVERLAFREVAARLCDEHGA